MLLLFCMFFPRSRCVACADGFYGPGCEHRCQCLNAGVCLSVSGACECSAGFIGARCNLSKSLHSKHRLHLIDCDFSTAQSSPLQRVQPDGTGGTVPMWPSVERGRETIRSQADVSEMNKVSQCLVCCSTCLMVSLMDVCVSVVCPAGWFGSGCSRRCDCSDRGLCDARSGNCSCGLGWTGSRCEKGDVCVHRSL